MNVKVDVYISKAKKWKLEMEQLRKIILQCGLVEEFKWRNPCYMFDKSNVVIIGEFKAYCAIMFFKGVLLQDVDGILIQQTENVQSARQIRFTSVQQIVALAPSIKAFIYEAIEVEKAGLKVMLKDNTDIVFVPELQNMLVKNVEFSAAFNALTPGRQRAYNFYFTAPKQSKTREQRIEKYMQRIINGKGLHDCICGLSKKMPNCDGSHKYIQKS
jgi:uncharacterized protein YdeI (YjbR/CyaY-like superfamily)